MKKTTATVKKAVPVAPAEKTDGAEAAKEHRRTDGVPFVYLRAEEISSPPKRHHESDSGYDLAVSTYCVVMPGTKAQLPHNIAVAIPAGHFGLILPRASTLQNRGLVVPPALIDEGYRGELFTMVHNPTNRAAHVNVGDHISQIVILPRADFEFHAVKTLPEGERGGAGFGSTGS